MCYFLYVATKDEISEGLVELYQQDHNIYFDKVNEYLKINVSNQYYLIHRQCSCDFIRTSDNSYNEISALFNILSKPFEIILLDKSNFPDVELDDVIINDTLTEELSLNKFLMLYPDKLVSSRKYIVGI
ncbi:hypothetical protein RB620_10820 [Paenibacillus sp. LHD-117]|uniref:hypothetical protein n=1 Tax=Paenibacillus sp. LHD-117 TaxID=3071412 RepID=UPI0027E0DA2D|nr:hypothetical protein [Paenibacillus sp. LHD-117]MDQ6419926.1 hypothetical protein [Paenibacillus sp. LHD-117]